ncbi:MAG TPA: hypothetical protein PLG57_02740 [Bacteroidia bacterium]|jgi:hypothetical protein|nr:hypothetical protein [Bacteroidia bacterium]HQF27179.1 hypothetical protein [Bacteroidia bacterium]
MKTKLLLLLILLVGCIGVINAENAKPPIKVIVKLYKKRTGCSEPRGMCFGGMEIVAAKFSDPSLTHCNATFEFNTLTLEISKSTMNDAARKSLIGYSTLPIDEDVSFTDEASRELGSFGPITIKAGEYPIRETLDKYILTFPIK